MHGNAPDKIIHVFGRELLHCPCELNLKQLTRMTAIINAISRINTSTLSVLFFSLIESKHSQD